MTRFPYGPCPVSVGGGPRENRLLEGPLRARLERSTPMRVTLRKHFLNGAQPVLLGVLRGEPKPLFRTVLWKRRTFSLLPTAPVTPTPPRGLQQPLLPSPVAPSPPTAQQRDLPKAQSGPPTLPPKPLPQDLARLQR